MIDWKMACKDMRVRRGQHEREILGLRSFVDALVTERAKRSIDVTVLQAEVRMLRDWLDHLGPQFAPPEWK